MVVLPVMGFQGLVASVGRLVVYQEVRGVGVVDGGITTTGRIVPTAKQAFNFQPMTLCIQTGADFYNKSSIPGVKS